MKKIILLICLVTVVFNVSAQSRLLSDNPLKTHLDSAIEKGAKAYMTNAGAVGLSIGIYSKGQQFIYNYGESIKGSQKLIAPDQFFNLGSVAKTFVGTMLAEAVVEKKAKLNDDIRLYLPSKYPNLEYNGKPVTLVEIANHTSALPHSMRTFPKAISDSVKKLSLPAQLNFYSYYTQDSILNDLHQFKLDTVPGTKYDYNGNAMMVLIFLLERIYHQPYEQLVTHYLKTHLDMGDTRTIIPADQLHRFIKGYNTAGKPIEWFDPGTIQAINTSLYYLGGPSMNSTMTDMLKYLKANIEEKDSAIRLTHQITWGDPKTLAIGLNWMLDLENGVKDFYHDGHTGIGFNTLCEFYPSEQLGFMIVVNDNIGQDKVSDLETAIHKAL
jgi:CubicO group peptidase (beta-lactamase class C family)